MHFNSIYKPTHKRALTLVEVLVTMTILTTILAGLVMASIQFGKSIDKVRNYVTSRKQLSSFIFSVTSFANKSLGAFFVDSNTSNEFDYLTDFTGLTPGDTMLNDLYLVKDNADTTGIIRYDPVERTLSWIRVAGATPVVMLENVVRPDYESENDTGTDPVFQFPHRSNLYSTTTRPKFVIFNFKVLVARSASSDEIVTLPVTLALKLKAIVF